MCTRYIWSLILLILILLILILLLVIILIFLILISLPWLLLANVLANDWSGRILKKQSKKISVGWVEKEKVEGFKL